LPYTGAKSAQWLDRWTFAQPAPRRLGRAADGDFAMNLIQQLEKEQFEKLSAGKTIPEFGPGDTVIVNVKVVEGDRSRVQAYEGVCRAKLYYLRNLRGKSARIVEKKTDRPQAATAAAAVGE
jgi:large subunit ribosomal protein L19